LTSFPRVSHVAVGFAIVGAALSFAGPARAQGDEVRRVDMSIGRSYPITMPALISQVSIATPDVADVVVIANREIVINAKTVGETDAIVWMENGGREHYRVAVHSASTRSQIALYVKFAEVRRDVLSQLGISALYRNGGTRVGTGIFRSDNVFDNTTGAVNIPGTTQFLSVLTDFDTRNLLGFLEAQEQRGNAKLLAEPNILAANKEEASFLAGGELPIPVVSAVGGTGVPQVGIQFKEFGVRLKFMGEVISDSLIKLAVEPEVSSIDFSNAIEISGFRIPAFQTRRVQSTVDVRPNQSLIISGLFNDQRQQVRTGIPLLQDIPILGRLFSSTQWQRNETELLVIVTPVMFDPLRPRQRDTLQIAPDSILPAHEIIEPLLVTPPSLEPKQVPQQPKAEPKSTTPAVGGTVEDQIAARTAPGRELYRHN
jgi:pilus assembly protein CpaC